MYICANLVRNNHEKISDIWNGLKSFCEERKLTVYVDYTGNELNIKETSFSNGNIIPRETIKHLKSTNRMRCLISSITDLKFTIVFELQN